MPIHMADSKHDRLMREIYYAFWDPNSRSFENSTGGPDWREASRAVAHPRGCRCRWCVSRGSTRPVVCRATLYNARAWAVNRGLPVRPFRASPAKFKLDPVTALSMCQEAFGDSADLEVSCSGIAERFGVSRGTLYRYRKMYLDGSLATMAADHALKNPPS